MILDSGLLFWATLYIRSHTPIAINNYTIVFYTVNIILTIVIMMKNGLLICVFCSKFCHDFWDTVCALRVYAIHILQNY